MDDVEEKLITIHPEFGIGVWRNIAVSIWHGQLTLAHVPMMERVWEALAESYPDGFGVFSIVTPEAPMVALDARRPVAALYERYADVIRGASVVVQAKGLKGTAARLVISAGQLMVRPSYPLEAHDSIGHGARWLGARAGQVHAAGAMLRMFTAYEARRLHCAEPATRSLPDLQTVRAGRVSAAR